MKLKDKTKLNNGIKTDVGITNTPVDNSDYFQDKVEQSEKIIELKENLYSDCVNSIHSREEIFDDLLRVYCADLEKQQEEKLRLKKWCFGFVVAWISLVLISPIIVIFIVLSCDISNTGVIASIVAVFGELLTGLIVLPKIITEYLFDKGEDAGLHKMAEEMLKYNENRYSELYGKN